MYPRCSETKPMQKKDSLVSFVVSNSVLEISEPTLKSAIVLHFSSDNQSVLSRFKGACL